MSGIDKIFGAGQTNYSTNVQRANKAGKSEKIDFTVSKPVEGDGWNLLGLNCNNLTEARMQEFLENDPKMKILNEMFSV